MSGCDVRVVHGAAALRAVRAAEGLLDRTGVPFCARPLWLSTWYTRSTARPLAVVVRRQRDIVGLAGLALHRTGLLATLTLAGDGPSDYGRLPAADDEAAAALAGGIVAVLNGIRPPWRVRLAQLPVGDAVAARLVVARPGARLVDGQSCPVMSFGPDRTPQRHLAAKSRRAARRGLNRLADLGVKVEVDRIDDPVRVGDLLGDVVALHRSRDRALGRRSDLDDPARRGFYLDALARLADAGQLDIWTLRLDGTLGAFVVGVRDGNSYRTLDARIAEPWQSVSPGQILRTEMISGLLAEPDLTELDWMRGVLRHKMQDATEVVAAQDLLAESSPWVTLALDRWQALRSGLRGRVPDSARRWIRSRSAMLSQPVWRSRAVHATPDAGPAGPPRPGAADGNPGPS